MRITNDLLESFFLCGAPNHSQIKILADNYPNILPWGKGWKHKLFGKEIDTGLVSALLMLRGLKRSRIPAGLKAPKGYLEQHRKMDGTHHSKSESVVRDGFTSNNTNNLATAGIDDWFSEDE